MNKKGYNTFGALLMSAFALLIGFIVRHMMLDMGYGEYESVLWLLTGITIIVIIVSQLIKWNEAKISYKKFEKLFPELKNGVVDLAEHANYFSELGDLAIYQGYFISNWEFDFIDLKEVESVYYERSFAIRSRTGVVSGNKPQLVFRKKNQEIYIIKIFPAAIQEYLPQAFCEMHKVNPDLKFGKEGLGLQEYLPLFERMR